MLNMKENLRDTQQVLHKMASCISVQCNYIASEFYLGSHGRGKEYIPYTRGWVCVFPLFLFSHARIRSSSPHGCMLYLLISSTTWLFVKGRRQQQEGRNKNKKASSEKRWRERRSNGRWEEALSEPGVWGALVAGMPYPHLYSAPIQGLACAISLYLWFP